MDVIPAVIVDRCPWPDCVLPVEHDGEHQCGRISHPLPPIRQTQHFENDMRCDIEGCTWAAHVFAIDHYGYGWMLCSSHLEEYEHASTKAAS